MIVNELTTADLSRRLQQPGVRLRIGPFVAEIRSSVPSVHAGIGLHYADHEIAGMTEFADFRVSVQASGGIRRWIRPKATFRFDGALPLQPLPANQAFPLLEWGLNWCVAMYCHQYLILHAAAIERNGRCAVLPAPPGSGKSTLCAALVARGWRLFSDELALIDLQSGAIVPLPRPISLKNTSIALMRDFWPEAAMGPVVHDTLKGSVVHVKPPEGSVRRAAHRATPGWIVLPRYSRGDATKLRPLSRGAAFMQLVDSAFNYSMHGRAGFDVLARVVDASECFEFTYGGPLDEATRAFETIAGPA